LLQNHQINVLLIIAMQLSESPQLLLLAQLDQLVPQPIVILQEDVSTTQSPANLLDVLTTLVTQLQTSVKSLFLVVMMVMLALPIPSTHLLAAFTLQNASLLTCAHSPLVLLELAAALLKIAMIATLAQLTLAISALELVSTLLSLALAELETLELAILKLLNVSSEKLAKTTAIVQEMAILLTSHTVILLLVAISLSAPAKIVLNLPIK
jgi:hypothetical protein